MTPADLSRTVLHAVRRAVADGALRVAVPERVVVERPRPGGSGDYATNAALRLAGGAGLAPREVAEILRARVATDEGIARVEITGPGFLNFTLAADDTDATLVRTVLRAGPRYGHGTTLTGTTVCLATPEEPRARVWTEAVTAVLRTQGATVTNPTDGARTATPPPVPETLRVVPAPAGDDLFGRLGADAARWALLRTPARERPPSGPAADGLLVQRESNPLFRVRYAHARTRAVTRAAERLGIPQDQTPVPDQGPDHDQAPDAHTTPTRTTLARLLRDHPAVLEAAARRRAPDHVARGLEDVAEAVLRFLESGRVLPVGDEKPSAAHRSRIALAEAAGAVLAGGLTLLGIDAPEFL
ncbi:ArgS-related anticodon-binding protein NrtL [Streptomyces liangshanensis]|uniref:arginine--tRNA ligase n=1 Tax=Streptomyces liangshanensis TaxID=2717324 RepID=A0A6G9GWP2_9ACTN|nr:DALR anticodon-binding domain-containing protein [Streptomyces liangshanensis]QIQ02692.1 arginine--tRNA ligase [Streptomyces liangshanensis]